ncbi:MAG TPA: TRAP transporter small permease [Burkholderiaceae bacterium]|nr:TRAP transporter small permease [Burkholderiaceae bacterium]HMY99540.1 TRAP transporter small permease [Burkholderiaceae bacterium]HNG80062.1 TRAP transporter small permease [Burkholderiaceae bacterium]
MQEPMPDAPGDAFAGFGPAGRVLVWLCKLCSVLGGLVFVALVNMSIVSIVGRKVASTPVPGDLELMQMGSAVGAAAFFAYCHMTRNDVKVDFFTQKLSARSVALLDAVGSLLVGLFGALITWRTWVGAMNLKEYGETSAILGWPIWVAQVLMVPGFALLAAAGFYMCFHFATRVGKGSAK